MEYKYILNDAKFKGILEAYAKGKFSDITDEDFKQILKFMWLYFINKH